MQKLLNHYTCQNKFREVLVQDIIVKNYQSNKYACQLALRAILVDDWSNCQSLVNIPRNILVWLTNDTFLMIEVLCCADKFTM